MPQPIKEKYAMSTKFEQLLDYLVNEEMDKANDLFHEIVVEKSREIYENLISEEMADESDIDESEETDESAEDLEEDDSESLEDSMEYEAEEEPGDDMPSADSPVMDKGDDLLGDIEDAPEDAEDEAMMDIKNAIAELEAAFAELEAAQSDEDGSDEFSDEEGDEEFGDEEGDEEFGDEEDDNREMEETMGLAMEGKRMTREYVEKVGSDWEKGSTQKTQGQYAGAGTGDKDGAPHEGKSAVSSGKGKPTTGATASNILGDKSTGEGTNVGTKPTGKTGGLVKNPQDMKTGNGNVPGGKMGVKNLAKVPGGHGPEKKGAAPGPVGSGSGEKAGQTSVAKIPQFLKPL